MSGRRGALGLIGAFLAVGVGSTAMPAAVVGQGVDSDLEGRVAATAEGVVRFAVRTRPDVWICEDGIRMGEDRWMERRNWRRTAEGASSCLDGPMQVEVEVSGGTVRDVEVLRAGRRPNPRAVDVGLVAPEDAARFLTSVIRTRGSRAAAEAAVMPLVLADVERVWPSLLEIARDRDVEEGPRKSALFWLGQEAAAAATVGLGEVARDRTEDQDIRDAAVFALSQRPAEEGVPLLMEVARTAEDAPTRRSAMFWLAQSGDPRVTAFFEEILLGEHR